MFNKIYSQKKQLRRKIATLAQNLDKTYKIKSSKKICKFVLSTSNYKNAKTIFCFVGMENEVDTKMIIEDALRQDKIVCVPLIIEKGIMVAKQIKSLKELSTKSYGLLEPSEDANTINPLDIDLCIVPCLSASHSGIRLGYGGGFYDRYMNNTYFTKICICYEKLTNEEIPKSKFDVKMDFLITEIGIQNFKE